MHRLAPPLLLILAAACAHPSVPSGGLPAPAEIGTGPGALPGMDSVLGPLSLKVEYPAEGSVVDARDSSFLFGSTGNGRTSLTVNGLPVRVWPNGAWIAWVPLPGDSLMRFEFQAVLGNDTAGTVRTVRRPSRFIPPPRASWIDTTSFTPSGSVRWPAGEPLALAVRAAPGATLSLWLGDSLLTAFAPDPRLPGVPEAIRAFDRDSANLGRAAMQDRYVARIRPLLTGDSTLRLRAVVGSDTAWARWPLRLEPGDPSGTVVQLDDDPGRTGATDGIVVARALPGGTYTWFWPNGTVAVSDARMGDNLRLALAPGVHAWIPAGEARELTNVPPPAPVVGSLTLTPGADRVTARIPLSQSVPYQVTESERRLDLLIYGAVSDINWLRYGPSSDSLLRSVTWTQEPAGVRISFALAEPVWGYRVRYDRGDLLFEIRRPPAMEAGHPLRNLLVVVDPGHPPVGATGPTGFREPDANLGIALKLRTLLANAGARVVMTRTTDNAVDLYPRTHLADSIGADLLISIHNNALPDGVNPFTNNGTSVFYNHPRSVPLARDVDAALVRELGVRDLGYARGDLALVRPTWMPAILTEGLFMMLPEQEAALRSGEGQMRYARGVCRGVLSFLAGRRGH